MEDTELLRGSMTARVAQEEPRLAGQPGIGHRATALSPHQPQLSRRPRRSVLRGGSPRWRGLIRAAAADLDMVCARDPSILTRREALLHPGIVAIWGYRVANTIHSHGKRCLARLVSNGARLLSGGIEIHPGASIGERFFIDHGTGVVIGETAVIGDDVTLFHQVTLGSVGWWHGDSAGGRRHPVLEDGVVVGANASILGAVTVGARSIIGAQSLVLKNVPANSRVVAPVGLTEPAQRHRARTQLRALDITDLYRAAATAQGQPFPVW